MAVYCLGIWHWTAQNPQALKGWVFSNAVGDWILTILTHNFATLPVASWAQVQRSRPKAQSRVQ
jgi:hypothetical protein